MMISPIETGAVYLAIALPLSVAAALTMRWPLTAATLASVSAMVLAAICKNALPFNFWAHANDFILEPFFQGKIVTSPLEGTLSLIFHIAVPTSIAMGVRAVYPKERQSV